MEISVLSGKGGTGKTTVSINLARAAGRAELLDCDVEEPNGHIFLKPENVLKERFGIEFPVIDREKCTNCGACGRFCNFNAFISSPTLTIAMKELCHSCGGCKLVCEQEAISYGIRETGSIFRGTSRTGGGDISLSWGELDVGELSGVKIIGELRSAPQKENLRITDCPPGTSCSAVEAVEETGFALIVAEPTPFGISDMMMVIDMLESLKIPMAAVINKAGLGDGELKSICGTRGIPVLGEIPFSREAAEVCSRGGILFDHSEEYRDIFTNLLAAVKSEAEQRGQTRERE